MKAATLLALIPTASAFVQPKAPLARGRALAMNFGYEAGNRPVGGVQFFPDSSQSWDPLGFTKEADEAYKWRLANGEIKNGRVAMLACLDYLVKDLGFKFPWADVYPDSYGLAAFTKLPLIGFWIPIIAVCGFLDVFTDGNGQDPGFKGNPNRVPGNVQPETEAFAAPGDEEIRTKEINNGRMAMISIFGMWASELISGNANVLEAFKPYAPILN